MVGDTDCSDMVLNVKKHDSLHNLFSHIDPWRFKVCRYLIPDNIFPETQKSYVCKTMIFTEQYVCHHVTVTAWYVCQLPRDLLP